MDRKTKWKRHSIAWEYFVDVVTVDGTKCVRCKRCRRQLAYSAHGNTANMYDHLKQFHPDLYAEAMREQKRRLLPRKKGITKPSLKPSLLEPKKEPEVIFEEAEVVYDTPDQNSVQLDSPETNESHEISYNNNSADSQHTEDERQEPSTSYTETRSNVQVTRIERFQTNDDMSSTLFNIVAELTSVKERLCIGNDAYFYQSVAGEMENMSEDSKDLVKACIWQIICRIKSARRKNVEMSLNALFKN